MGEIQSGGGALWASWLQIDIFSIRRQSWRESQSSSYEDLVSSVLFRALEAIRADHALSKGALSPGTADQTSHWPRNTRTHLPPLP